MKYITKRAYINSLAARGVLKHKLLNKQAASGATTETNKGDDSKTTDGGTKDSSTDNSWVPNKLPTGTPEGAYPWNPGKDQPMNAVDYLYNLSPEEQAKEREAQKTRHGYLTNSIAVPGNYMTPGLVGTGIGAIIGALVQGARDKDMLAGAGIGAGIGGLAGLGGKYINDTYIYPEVEKAYNNSGAGPYLDFMDEKEEA